MTTELSKPVKLSCCCCGEYMIGRQWHNRDTGYGMCAECVDDFNEPEENVGVRGVHYDIKPESE